MKQSNRFWKFALSALFTVLVITGSILFFFWRTLSQEQTIAILSIITGHPLYVAGLFFLCAGVLLAGLQAIFHIYIKPLKKLSAEASMIYSSNPSHRITMKGIRDIRNMSQVINDFAELFENLNRNITEQILNARQEIEKERNLLAAIMAELPQGVIICNKNGRILLFNSMARKIFTQGQWLKPGEQFIGLGRSIFHLIDRGLLEHAVREVEDHLNNGRQSVESCFMTSIASGHLVSVETIPVLDHANRMTGFILILQDVSDVIRQYDISHEQIQSLKKDLSVFERQITECFSGPSLFTSGENLVTADQINDMLKVILSRYEAVSETILDIILTPLPLTLISVPEFLNAVQRKIKDQHGIELIFEDQTESGRMSVDRYSFTAAVIFLMRNLAGLTHAQWFRISTDSANQRIVCRIDWPGKPVPKQDIENLLSKRINALPSLFYVMKQNRAVLQIIQDDEDGCTGIHIVTRAEFETPVKKNSRSPVIAASRPEFYDFDLFRTESEHVDLMDSRLDKITYTVFDTETTGLNPEGGDEIISMAAVRIVNKRIVYQDVFDELIDPKRDIPMDSYKIHGIHYEMVTGKKELADVLPVFKRFTQDTVLLGHNIAFDMKMLKVKEKVTHIRFMNPVLDTLLLSALLHPLHEHHDLENIARRLGVRIIGRHTALGDAITTAEIFLKLLPILNSNGILTLNDAIRASKKTYYARLKY